jgi:hypothetical protein
MAMMRILAGALLALSAAELAYADEATNVRVPSKAVASVNAPATNVVLVHGGTTDGSGWKDVFQLLRAKELMVTIV